MSNIATNDFNYGSVDEDTAMKLEYYATTGKNVFRKGAVQFIADLGRVLSDARKLLSSHKKGEGMFLKWAMAEFDLSKQTIYNYVNAWDQHLVHGWEAYVNWSPTALYESSGEDFPKVVVKKLRALPAADMVRASDVKRLVAEVMPPKVKEDDPPFEESTAVTKAKKKEQREAERAAEKERKEKERAAEKERKRLEREAEKERKRLEREAEKERKKKEREDEKERKRQEKLAAMKPGEQAKLTKDVARQLIYKAVNAVDDYSELKDSPSWSGQEGDEFVQLLYSLRGDSKHDAIVKLLQHIAEVIW